jgi:class 3 adenylate cyclase
MKPAVDNELLKTLLADLEEARAWSDELAICVDELVRSSDDKGLLRLSPLGFAREHDLDEMECVDYFLFATRAGLFDMEWLLFCAACGCVVESLRTLNSVHAHYRCEVCAAETDACLDDYIAVGFTISPRVRAIAFHDPASLTAEEYYYQYKYCAKTWFYGGVIPEVVNDILTADYFRQSTRFLATLAPGEKSVFDLVIEPDFLGLDESVRRSQGFFMVGGEATTSEQSFDLTVGTMPPVPFEIRPGPLSLRVTNDTAQNAHLMGCNLTQNLFVIRERGVRIDDVLLAKNVLVNTTFKELFREELIADDEGIGIRHLTTLFTDLKGSTDLYDRIGDLQAFALVRESFEVLSKVIAQHSGVVVKTIGDAVMAAFVDPLDGVRAASAILDEIAAVNARMTGDALLLKIGLHHGPTIAVTMNERVDYFGQSVNIASRVQGLAGAEEICLTDSVFEAPGVSDFLRDAEPTSQSAALLGIAERVTVYRISRQ